MAQSKPEPKLADTKKADPKKADQQKKTQQSQSGARPAQLPKR